ncbi:hypothetical protein B0H12DRAFT_1104609 [Mycena haematopus]|nr:hypothetical protein B0H12DRAFT_1104609 [Mycena haematopus]
MLMSRNLRKQRGCLLRGPEHDRSRSWSPTRCVQVRKLVITVLLQPAERQQAPYAMRTGICPVSVNKIASVECGLPEQPREEHVLSFGISIPVALPCRCRVLIRIQR